MKQKEREDIRRQVVIGIFQWVGYVLLGVLVLGLISVPFFGCYYAGKDDGYQYGRDDVFEYVWNIAQEDNSVILTYTDGRSLELYKDQCPSFCNWKSNDNFFKTGNTIFNDVLLGDKQ